jgi:hypothetical protein
MAENDAPLRALIDAILSDNFDLACRLLEESPQLATACFHAGATRANARDFFVEEIGYIVAGDTALHVAAASYRTRIARVLIAAGADIKARNRHGAEPLHAAAVGQPGSRNWNPPAQNDTIVVLINAGADPNAIDKRGVTPLHRAVRTRCAAAVKALLDHGADPALANKGGSTPMLLATLNTGRGGSGGEEAKLQQREILRMLEQHAADCRNPIPSGDDGAIPPLRQKQERRKDGAPKFS